VRFLRDLREECTAPRFAGGLASRSCSLILHSIFGEPRARKTLSHTPSRGAAQVCELDLGPAARSGASRAGSATEVAGGRAGLLPAGSQSLCSRCRGRHEIARESLARDAPFQDCQRTMRGASCGLPAATPLRVVGFLEQPDQLGHAGAIGHIMAGRSRRLDRVRVRCAPLGARKEIGQFHLSLCRPADLSRRSRRCALSYRRYQRISPRAGCAAWLFFHYSRAIFAP